MIGIRPPTDSGSGGPATRHPRIVRDEMEAIFGVPSSLNTIRRGYATGVNTHVEPEFNLRHRMGSLRLWIAILVVVLGALSICGLILASGVFDQRGRRSADFATHAPDGPVLPDVRPPSATIGAPASGPAPDTIVPKAKDLPIAAAPRVVPQPAATPIAPPLPPVAATAPTRATSLPAKDDPARILAAMPVAAKPDPRRGPCGGTSYQNMPICPPTLVLKADSALGAAYANAISANVDPARLSAFSQKWSGLRDTAAADPEYTADEFANMASQLNALTLAASSRKK